MRSERHVTLLVGFFLGLAVLAGSLIGGQAELRAQQPGPRKAPVRKPPAKAAEAATAAPAKPQVKGIWEPVNYTEDLNLTDVFFVTPEVGWVSGAKGTILHTKDGGATWTAQLGGDPQSGGNTIEGLRFVDETHGWAFQRGWAGRLGMMLLRTTDGENWEEVGPLGEYVGWKDYQFTSEAEGVLLAMGSQQDAGKDIWRTQDSGRHWQQVFTCQTKTQVGGLTRDVDCLLMGLHFPSPLIGYAIGANRGITDRIFVAKTEDGGTTWNVRLVPGPEVGDSFSAKDLQAFFVDENTGFICLQKGGKVYATTDGGESWLGLIAAPTAGRSIKFADPEVAWSFNRSSLVYTIDGGKRWISRPIAFPVEPTAFSFPRRDRGYVVGDHGMIYRYRVVPATEEVAANAIAAPAMPGFESPLDEEVEELVEEAAALEESFSEAPAEAAGEGAEAPPEGAPQEPAEEPAEEAAEAAGEGPAPFVDSCCAKPLSKFESTLNQVSTLLPAFVGKYKNLNLILAGLRMTSEMPSQVSNLKAAVANLRKARDPMTARMALTELIGQATALSESTLQAFQKKPVPSEPPEQ